MIREDVGALLDQAIQELVRIQDEPFTDRRVLQRALSEDLIDTGTSALAAAAAVGDENGVDRAREMLATGRLLTKDGFGASPGVVFAAVGLRLARLKVFKSGGRQIRFKRGDAEPRRLVQPYQPTRTESLALFERLASEQARSRK
jgi:hypothetical protein